MTDIDKKVPKGKAEIESEGKEWKFEFRAFTSIDNVTNTKFIQEVSQGVRLPSETKEDAQVVHTEKDDGERWVATEKVHGANFLMECDGNQVICAKRTGYIEEGTKFFSYEKVASKYEAQTIALFNSVKENVPELVTVGVCGELFGGVYPHPDIPAVEGVQHVQKEVFYCPDIDFYGFDVRLRVHRQDENGERKDSFFFLPYEECCELYKAHGFFYAEPIAHGTLDELLAFDVESFETTIPAKLGLPPPSRPPARVRRNYAEGIVIKRVDNARSWKTGKRAIFKKKHSSFSEKAPRSDKPPKASGPPQPRHFPEAVENLFQEASLYITENRLACVVSKEGSDAPEAKLTGLLSKDALSDFFAIEENATAYDQLVKGSTDTSLKKRFNTRLNVLSSELVNTYRKSLA